MLAVALGGISSVSAPLACWARLWCLHVSVYVSLGACRGHERTLDWGLQAVLLTDVDAENCHAQICEVSPNRKGD